MPAFRKPSPAAYFALLDSNNPHEAMLHVLRVICSSRPRSPTGVPLEPSASRSSAHVAYEPRAGVPGPVPLCSFAARLRLLIRAA
jgi:hypothetical protein